MSTFETDDLLLRSQILISKFRQQREAAHIQHVSFTKKPLRSNQYENTKDNYIPNRNRDCDPYPQREKDNVLLNNFTREYYFNHSKTPINCNREIFDKDELSSNSGSSVWSSSSHIEKVKGKVDCGIMTDRIQNSRFDEDDVMTPVTTLPPTFRPPEVNKTKLVSRSSPPKMFSSICTQFKLKDFDTENVISTKDDQREIISDERSHEWCQLKSNEDDQMKAAWEYFQEEKGLEKQISEQTKIVDDLTKEMDTLLIKIENESHKLDFIKNKKEEFRNQRYGIFNGLSKEIQPNKKEGQNSIISSEYLIDQSSERVDADYDSSQLPNLDDETVRNIVNRIVCKEFCNTDDKIFDNIREHPMECFYKDESREADEELALSDVYSIKDLKITPSSLDNDTKTTGNTMTSSMSIFNNSTSTCELKPPKFKKRMRPARSVDNINQMVANSNTKRRSYAQSPSVSVILKPHLYSSSSSDESIFESKVHNGH